MSKENIDKKEVRMNNKGFRFSSIGKIIVGLILVYMLFSMFRYLMMYINPSLIKEQLESLDALGDAKAIETYRAFLPIELIRIVVSVVGLTLILLGNKNGPSIYLGSEMVSSLLMFLRGDVVNGVIKLIVPIVVIVLLFAIPNEFERKILPWVKDEN